MTAENRGDTEVDLEVLPPGTSNFVLDSPRVRLDNFVEDSDDDCGDDAAAYVPQSRSERTARLPGSVPQGRAVASQDHQQARATVRAQSSMVFSEEHDPTTGDLVCDTVEVFKLDPSFDYDNVQLSSRVVVDGSGDGECV